jgi:hypothetical protein
MICPLMCDNYDDILPHRLLGIPLEGGIIGKSDSNYQPKEYALIYNLYSGYIGQINLTCFLFYPNLPLIF